MASREFIDDLYTAMDESRASASENLMEDALLEITGLHGKPYTRQRLLLLLALDDIQASSTDTTIKERIGILKDALQGFVYVELDPRRDHICIQAQEELEDVDEDDDDVLTTYNALLPIHLDMLDTERKEEEEAVRLAEEAARLAEEQARLAEEQARLAEEKAIEDARLAKETAVNQREEARLARIARFQTK